MPQLPVMLKLGQGHWMQATSAEFNTSYYSKFSNQQQPPTPKIKRFWPDKNKNPVVRFFHTLIRLVWPATDRYTHAKTEFDEALMLTAANPTPHPLLTVQTSNQTYT